MNIDHTKRLLHLNLAMLFVGLVINNPFVSYCTFVLFAALTIGEDIEKGLEV
jgi:hypothetical protein